MTSEINHVHTNLDIYPENHVVFKSLYSYNPNRKIETETVGLRELPFKGKISDSYIVSTLGNSKYSILEYTPPKNIEDLDVLETTKKLDIVFKNKLKIENVEVIDSGKSIRDPILKDGDTIISAKRGEILTISNRASELLETLKFSCIMVTIEREEEEEEEKEEEESDGQTELMISVEIDSFKSCMQCSPFLSDANRSFPPGVLPYVDISVKTLSGRFPVYFTYDNQSGFQSDSDDVSISIFYRKLNWEFTPKDDTYQNIRYEREVGASYVRTISSEPRVLGSHEIDSFTGSVQLNGISVLEGKNSIRAFVTHGFLSMALCVNMGIYQEGGFVPLMAIMHNMTCDGSPKRFVPDTRFSFHQKDGKRIGDGVSKKSILVRNKRDESRKEDFEPESFSSMIIGDSPSVFYSNKFSNSSESNENGRGGITTSHVTTLLKNITDEVIPNITVFREWQINEDQESLLFLNEKGKKSSIRVDVLTSGDYPSHPIIQGMEKKSYSSKGKSMVYIIRNLPPKKTIRIELVTVTPY